MHCAFDNKSLLDYVSDSSTLFLSSPKNPAFPQVSKLVGGDKDVLLYIHLQQKSMSKSFKTDQNLYEKCYLYPGVFWWKCKILPYYFPQCDQRKDIWCLWPVAQVRLIFIIYLSVYLHAWLISPLKGGSQDENTEQSYKKLR